MVRGLRDPVGVVDAGGLDPVPGQRHRTRRGGRLAVPDPRDHVQLGLRRVGEPRRPAGEDDIVDEAGVGGERVALQDRPAADADHPTGAGAAARDVEPVVVDLEPDRGVAHAETFADHPAVPGAQVGGVDVAVRPGAEVGPRTTADGDALGLEAGRQVDPVEGCGVLAPGRVRLRRRHQGGRQRGTAEQGHRGQPKAGVDDHDQILSTSSSGRPVAAAVMVTVVSPADRTTTTYVAGGIRVRRRGQSYWAKRRDHPVPSRSYAKRL